MRRRAGALLAAFLAATGVVQADTARDAAAGPVTVCAHEGTTETLLVTMDSDGLSAVVARAPDDPATAFDESLALSVTVEPGGPDASDCGGATLTNTATVRVTVGGSGDDGRGFDDQALTLDLGNGPFQAPGAADSLKFDVRLGQGVDHFTVLGSQGPDRILLAGDNGTVVRPATMTVNLDGDGTPAGPGHPDPDTDTDVTARITRFGDNRPEDFPFVTVDGRGGDDSLRARDFPGRFVPAGRYSLTIHGGDGGDVVVGGRGAIDPRDGGPSVVDGGAGDDDLTGGLGAAVAGGPGDDVLRGNSSILDGGPGDDALTAGAAPNVLLGGPGHDGLVADAGDDVLDGGPGDDVLDGGAGTDILDFSSAPGAMRIDLTQSPSSGPAGTDTFSGLEATRGTLHGDVFVATSGPDHFDGNLGRDTVDYGHASAGVVVTTASPQPQATGGSGTDSLFRIEDILGGAGDDVLTGDSGQNRLEGRSGNDTLTGGLGDDDLVGGPGDDAIDEGPLASGADAISGGAGADRVDYSRRIHAVSATLDGVADDGEMGERDDLRSDVERVLLPSTATPKVPGLQVLGELPALRGCQHPTNPKFDLGAEDAFGPCPMLVDPARDIGFSVGYEFAAGQTPFNGAKSMFVYDLERLAVARKLPCTDACLTALGYGAIDPVRARLYMQSPLWPGGDGVATASHTAQRNPCAVSVLEYGDLASLAVRPRAYDCPPDSANLVVLGTAVTPGGEELYLSGAPKEEFAVRRHNQNFASGSINALVDWTTENLGQALLVRRLEVDDAGDLRYGWDLDLRGAGCGRRAQPTGSDPVIPPFITRVGSDLIAYCWDTKFVYWNGSSVSGPQGYMVRIPLDAETGRPLGVDGAPLAPSASPYVSYQSVRTPTLPGYLRAVADPHSGLVALVTNGDINGNAAWLFDPRSDRFLGVVTGGSGDQPRNNTAVGFDSASGRAYLLTEAGIVVAPTRNRPLPAGVVYPVAQNAARVANWTNTSQIAISSNLRRLFVPINFPDQAAEGPRHLVLEDAVPDPPPLAPADPDANTVQLDEGPDTEVVSRGAASAAGAHLVVTGGVTRTVDAADPACFTLVPVGESDSYVVVELWSGSVENTYLAPFEAESPEGVFADRRCAGSQVVGEGHRELFLGASRMDAGSNSGATAEGAPLLFGSNDVTGADIAGAGACASRQLANVHRGGSSELEDGHADACTAAWDGLTARKTDAESGTRRDAPAGDADPRGAVPDARDGTRGREGDGFPFPISMCSDFGGQAGTSEDTTPLAASHASCDVAASTARAGSSGGRFHLAAGGQVVLSVASTESSVVSAQTADGQVTVASARAQGVVVGPLSIREVRSVAVTRAQGRTGTAHAELERRWCGVELVGEAVSSLADDLRPQVEELRRLLLPHGRAAYGQAASCLDPTDPDNAAFLTTLNQVLLGKVRLSITDPNEEAEADGIVEPGEDSPGGYQAVVIKHPDAVGGDSAVNDDDSVTVAGLEATLFNDGPKGRNRYVVQLAGVHAESRYGVTSLPRFGGSAPPGSGPVVEGVPGTPGTPGTTRFLPGSAPDASAIVEGEVFEYIIEGGGLAGIRDDFPTADPIRRFLRWLPDAVKDLLRLFIQHPVEFALLFLVFSLLGAPAYMAYRRRTFVGVVAG